MKRREFLGLVAGVAASRPLVSRAQNTSHAPKRIAFFPDVRPETIRDWRADMRALGWTEERDFIVVPSGIETGKFIPLDEAARRLVASNPDVICTMTTAYALALQRATRAIPIVMLTSGYPVEAGLAESLARPGRNVTGNASYAGTGVWGKLLQLLHDANPGIGRVGILWTYVPPAFPKEEIEPGYAELESAARSLKLEPHIVEVADSDQVQSALEEIAAWKPDGLLLTSLLSSTAKSVVAQFAVDKGLSSIADFDWTPVASPQPLLCYGPLFRELVQSAAASVDKILRGFSPAELPIRRPGRFELVVNLKTAKAIGVDLSPTFLAQADRVVE
jgi:putative tryptophan/tyrosine transport system substrate-binding protein